MRPLRWLPLLALLVATSCQQAAPAVPPSIASFTANPPTVRSGEPSTLSWSVTGATTLSIAPGIGDVTGTTAVAVLPTTTTAYTLTATNTAGSDSEAVTVTVDDTITVEGRVIGLAGRPTAGAAVVIAGRPPATTDADGRFAVAGVQAPYDLTVMHPAEDLAIAYLGLTVERPTLVQPGGGLTVHHHATVDGTVSGGAGFPQPAGHRTSVAFGSPDARASVNAAGATGAFSLTSLAWFGPTTTAGALHALQWRVGPTDLPEAYTGHGYRPLTLQAGSAPYTGQDMALLPISSSSLSGTVAVPAGVTLGQRALFVSFAEGGFVPIVGETTSATSFTYVTPVIADATVGVAALGGGAPTEFSWAMRAGLLPGATSVDVQLPAVPQLVVPLAGTTGVGHATDFSWSSPAGGVVIVQFEPDSVGPTISVVTTTGSASIPEVSGLGLALPATATYRWRVYAFPEYPTVDAATADGVGFLGSWPFTTFAAWRRDGAVAMSVARVFVTAP